MSHDNNSLTKFSALLDYYKILRECATKHNVVVVTNTQTPAPETHDPIQYNLTWKGWKSATGVTGDSERFITQDELYKAWGKILGREE